MKQKLTKHDESERTFLRNWWVWWTNFQSLLLAVRFLAYEKPVPKGKSTKIMLHTCQNKTQ